MTRPQLEPPRPPQRQRFGTIAAGLTLMLGGLFAATPTTAAPVTSPDDIAALAPGTVLDARPVTIAAGSLIPVKITAWQLRYRTNDATGNPVVAITTAMLPYQAGPDPSRPLLAYDSFEDSIPASCAPSYQLQQNLNWSGVPVQIELVMIAAGLRQGWAVTVPDHLGPTGEYLAGRMSGQATLDAIRATESFGAMGLNGPRTKVGVLGYSGGAHAAEWTSTLSSGYAPELNIVGVAAGGVPPDIQAVYNKINRTVWAGIAVTGIEGLRQAYPELDQYVDQHTTAAGKSAFDKTKNQCLQNNVIQNPYANIDTYFTVPDPLHQPIPQKYLALNTMPSDIRTDAPTYLFHTVGDEVLPIAPVDDLVAGRCAAGDQIVYRRDSASNEHVLAAIAGLPGAAVWLKDRFDGVPLAPGCDIRTVPTTLTDPRNAAFLGDTLFKSLLDIAGYPVGPDDAIG
ncbi:lipase family protein [Fodinicola acaciae]|uniref:lipase family protein n=1 Tax=Fodinicola acaciae TaxID=2681555 RepID=UPI0013D1EE29|nr:lipase family protein [Fodinicola acaciae]